MVLDVKIDVGISNSLSSDFNRKYDLCWEAGCVKDCVNTMVLNRYLGYQKIEFEVSRASFLHSFWEVFGVLGVTFGGLRGYRNIVENSPNSEDSREPQDLRGYARVVKGLSRLAVNSHQTGYKTVIIQATRI